MSINNTQHAAPGTQHSVELHIERLVLHDVPVVDRGRIGAAVEHALRRLFAEGGTPGQLAQGGARARLSGGSFDIAPGADTEAIGAQVAQALYEGLRSGF
jgi:hypothetical protein